MSRQLKRVALDFDWPMNETWEGFLNPWYKFLHQCGACHGTGCGPLAKRFQDEWYGAVFFDPASTGSKPFVPDQPEIVAHARRNVGHVSWSLRAEIGRLLRLFNGQWSHHLCQADVDALWASGRLRDFTEKPTAEQVNVWSLSGLGHDSINCWACIEARCQREGIEPKCPVCDGEGSVWSNPDAKAKADAWKPTEPPAGEGWQMWETVSEGSPISPVFKTPEELASWLTKQPGPDATYDQWLAMITGPGWAPSGIADSEHGYRSGVAAVGDEIVATKEV